MRHDRDELVQPPGAVIEESRSVSHTPGPWHVRKCEGGYRAFDADDFVIISKELITPALVWGGALKEGEANARLIAAAPTMLKALQLAQFAFGFGSSATPDQQQEAAEAITAAILEATNGNA